MSGEKRIMREFRMNEVSAVDLPAQKGARAVIMKRDDEDYWKRAFTDDERQHLAGSGAALPDGSFPITNAGDLKNAIHAFGRAKDPAKAKAHIISRAKSLGATNLLPNDWVSKHADGSVGNHTEVENMTTDELNKAIADAVAKANADLTKMLTEANAKIAKMGADNKKKPQAADDSATDGVPEPDADDEAKKAWRPYVDKRIAKAVEAALAKQADITKGDEVIKVGETEIRKSENPTMFAVVKAQQDLITAQVEKAEIAEFAKQAETDYSRLPGETVAKAKALRAISKLAKEHADVIAAMLKGGNTAFASHMKSLGRDSAAEGSAAAQIEKRADAIATEKKISKAEAMAGFLETAEGRDLYTASLNEARATAH